MTDIRCNIDDMHPTLMQILKEYGDKGTKAVNLAVEEEAKDIRKKIRQNAGGAGIGGKRYKGGWRVKKEMRANGVQCTIYNGSEPGLVHLLEKGHRVVAYRKDTGKRTHAFEHVGPSTQDMERELTQKIEKNLELLS